MWVIASKSETCLAESKNSVIRRCLARFNRRTCRHSKTIEMIKNSLILLFNKNIFLSMIG
jgi:IS1 family transposase